jgi:hypothetical protein
MSDQRSALELKEKAKASKSDCDVSRELVTEFAFRAKHATI